MARKAANKDINKASVAPTSHPARSPEHSALAFLGAVPLVIDIANDVFSTPDGSALTTLFKLPTDRLPRTYNAFLSMLSREAQSQRQSAISNLKRDQDHYTVTYAFTAQDGARMWIEERGGQIIDPDTNTAIIHSVLRDVSEEKQAELRTAYKQTQTTRPENTAPITTADIQAALDNDTLTLAYQPIVAADTRDIHHYECLLRRETADGTLTSAAPYIIAAETLGLVHLLDKRALDIGCKTLQLEPDIHLGFNVSAGTIESEHAAKAYLDTLKSLGPDARRVTLEMTETLALKDDQTAALFSEQARALGCHFAIDDFGTGHTTFKNLMTIGADIIKIDGSMVTNLSDNPCKQAFIRIIVDMARTFGVETVAEMVTDHKDAAILQDMGVTYFQSYIFGKPEPRPVSA